MNYTFYIMKRQKNLKIAKLFSHNLRVLREKHKMSVIDLADKCNVTRQTIYNLENGSLPKPPQLEAICKVFKIEEHELYQLNTKSE